MTLKRKVIRLAYQRPDLRKDLLALLKRAYQKKGYDIARLRRLRQLNPKDPDVARMMERQLGRAGKPIKMGEGTENRQIRIHRYMGSIHVTDLTNAGRRGKNVDVFVIYDLTYARKQESKDLIDAFTAFLRTADYKSALETAKEVLATIKGLEDYGSPGIQERQEKGVRVDPPSMPPIDIQGALIQVKATLQDFVVKDLVDKNNEPTVIQKDRMGPKKFYKWLDDPANQKLVKNITFRDMLGIMDKLRIKYHYYLAID